MKKKKISYVKENKVSLRLTGKTRKPTSRKFRALIDSLNNVVEQILTKVELTEEQAEQARSMGLENVDINK